MPDIEYETPREVQAALEGFEKGKQIGQTLEKERIVSALWCGPIADLELLWKGAFYKSLDSNSEDDRQYDAGFLSGLNTAIDAVANYAYLTADE